MNVLPIAIYIILHDGQNNGSSFYTLMTANSVHLMSPSTNGQENIFDTINCIHVVLVYSVVYTMTIYTSKLAIITMV